METKKEDTEIVKEARECYYTNRVKLGLPPLSPGIFVTGYIEGYKAALKELTGNEAPTIHRQNEG